MPPKRRSKVGENSQAEAEVDEVAPGPKRLRAEQLFDDAVESISETQSTQRRSSRAGKGRGGTVKQLENIECIQTRKPLQRAARNLDRALEGHDVNPMAPSYTLGEDDEESQVPPWAQSSAPLTQVQPTFTLSQLDQRFGFKLPSRTTASTGMSYPAAPRSQSAVSTTPSSRSSSLPFGGASRMVSTPPTSRMPSECGSTNDYNNGISSQGGRQASQHAMTGAETRSSGSFQGGISVSQALEPTGGAPGPRPPVGLNRTHSFLQLPSTLPRAHSMFLENDTGGAREDRDDNTGPRSLSIDELSPDEDKRSAISVVRGQHHSAPIEGTNDGTNNSMAGSDVGLGEQHGRTDAPGFLDHNHVSQWEEEDGSQRRRFARSPNNQVPSNERDEEHNQLNPHRNHPQREVIAQQPRRNVSAHPPSDRRSEQDRPTVPNHRRSRVPEREVEDVVDEQGDQPTVPNPRHGRVPDRQVEDVVARHRQHNRPPRLPTNTQLLAARDEQINRRSHSISCASSDELDTPLSARPEALVSAGPQTHPHPARSATIQDSGDFSQLHSYPPPIRDVIERAKQFSHCDLASVNSFPLRSQFNSKAVEYMDEAVLERRQHNLTIPEGWWPQHLEGITKLLWEDIGNWRSALKKKARGFVRQSYKWDPQNRRNVNADMAKALVDRGSFLMHGTDDEGCTNNLAHPALEGLIIKFFYTGANAMGSLFPEVFADEVLRPAVTLAATAIKLALDEIVAEGKEVTFKRDIYAGVYQDVLGLMSKCDTAPIHRAKTKALRVQWARSGSNGGLSRVTTGFDVDLD